MCARLIQPPETARNPPRVSQVAWPGPQPTGPGMSRVSPLVRVTRYQMAPGAGWSLSSSAGNSAGSSAIELLPGLGEQGLDSGVGGRQNGLGDLCAFGGVEAEELGAALLHLEGDRHNLGGVFAVVELAFEAGLPGVEPLEFEQADFAGGGFDELGDGGVEPVLHGGLRYAELGGDLADGVAVAAQLEDGGLLVGDLRAVGFRGGVVGH